MNPTHRLLLAGATSVVLLSAGLCAQTQIGTRYLSIGLEYSDVDDEYGTTGDGVYAAINFPLCSGIDLQADFYDYDYDNDFVTYDEGENPVGWDQDGYGGSIGVLAYKAVDNYKAFSRLLVGAESTHLRLGPIDDDDMLFYWAISCGIEWEVQPNFSVGFAASYTSAFNDPEFDGYDFDADDSIRGGVFGHFRITKMLGLEAAVSVNDDQDLHFSAGTTLSF